MKHVPLAALEDSIVRPGFEKHLLPLLEYRGNLSLGRAHRLWNMMIAAMLHEASAADVTQRLLMNGEYSHLCGPAKPLQSSGLISFANRLRDNPQVMANMPGLAEYVEWILPAWRKGFSLEHVSKETHRRRHMGAGGWRTFVDDRPSAGLLRRKPIPADFARLAATLSDLKLVDHYRTSYPVVKRWRSECGVARPPRAFEPRELVYPFLIHDGGKAEHILLRKVNDAVPKGLDPNLRADMCQDLIVGILCGELSEEDILLPSRELTKRIWKSSPARYGERSLDSLIFNDGDMTLLDTLADEGRDWA